MPKRESRAVVLRLAAEFVVIVVGVLVALGFDSWAADRRDRALESEYLARLLDDVRYDLDELAFVDSISKMGYAVSRRMTAPGATDTMPASEVVAGLLVVANVRVPDLSRSTFEELINSGQIELLQSDQVRRALASYNRTVNELATAWNVVDPELRHWVTARIPHRVSELHSEECRSTAEEGIYGFTMVCRFDMGGWSASALVADLSTEDAQQRLRQAEYNYKAHELFVALLTEEARALETTLAAAVGGR